MALLMPMTAPLTRRSLGITGGWHCGSSVNGSANNTHIGVEMCEPACITYTGGSTFKCSDLTKTRAAAKRTYETAVDLFAMLCNKYEREL